VESIVPSVLESSAAIKAALGRIAGIRNCAEGGAERQEIGRVDRATRTMKSNDRGMEFAADDGRMSPDGRAPTTDHLAPRRS